MEICYACGDTLDRSGLCIINQDCKNYSQPPCEHPQVPWPERTAQDCPDRSCAVPETFCEYFAEPDGTCCNDECPSHDPEFMEVIEAHWAVRDGLVRPEGGLTELGKRHREWLAGCIPEHMTKEVETKA